MSSVRIVTDSNASLSPDLIERYGIEVIPHVIRVGRVRQEETPDLSADRLFQLVRENRNENCTQVPQLEAPDLNRLIDVYQRLGREADQILAIHMSSHLSPMWRQSRRAAEMMMGRYRIRVIDSLTTSMGLGILVEIAAKAAAEGATIHEVARLVNGAIPHMYATFFAETLHYLERSANLGAAQSVLGTLLGIKAMLTMEDGVFIPLEKVQERDQVVDKLYDFVVEFARIERIGVVQHHYEEAQAAFLERLKENLPHVPVEQVPYTPSLAVHLGPNIMGVIVYEGSL